ncbi:MAG: RagB/SusD family nutrient uptake outer membrane protein [Odoribacter sp.]|nr:RagB/SusD family nutrient uptake outer membrane protein [Odoribacter sp.]
MWLSMYNNIVNANILLRQLEKEEHPYFEDGVLDIIKGEALALRAYMYFDLFRLFNESLEVNPNSNQVPFKTDFSFEIGSQVTSTYLLEQLKNDLVQAQRLLLATDPIVSGKNYKDKYVLYDRTQRMNYCAVTALLAHLYMHTGNYKEAYENALIVIESGKFHFIEEEEIIEKDMYGNTIKVDRVFMTEMVFGLYSTDFLTISRRFLERLSDDFLISDGCYSGGDIRRNWLYVNPSALNRLQLIRFQQSQAAEDAGIYPDPVVPMLKLSEMYLITAEALLKDNSLSGSPEELLNTFKQARKADLLQAGASAEAIMDEITHEYICDFKGEGQLFLYYKRLNLERIDNGRYDGNTLIMDIANYTFPLPQYEIDFGYGK